MSATIQKGGRCWTVRVRPADRFGEVRYPEWAQRIAQRHSTGARVRLGQLATDGWLVEVVRLSRQFVPDRATAELRAEEITEEIEA